MKYLFLTVAAHALLLSPKNILATGAKSAAKVVTSGPGKAESQFDRHEIEMQSKIANELALKNDQLSDEISNEEMNDSQINQLYDGLLGDGSEKAMNQKKFQEGISPEHFEESLQNRVEFGVATGVYEAPIVFLRPPALAIEDLLHAGKTCTASLKEHIGKSAHSLNALAKHGEESKILGEAREKAKKIKPPNLPEEIQRVAEELAEDKRLNSEKEKKFLRVKNSQGEINTEELDRAHEEVTLGVELIQRKDACKFRFRIVSNNRFVCFARTLRDAGI
eukprot:GHVP01015179.1.p1 GENE.GHVP01015179.1~~GHVP01015179.1.p1  ORF type:complete len:278 (-),score=58.93 GHVP01015179.1:513-1346(-)